MISKYYVYILRCQDNSLYTGITTDLNRRFMEHSSSQKGAKYTHSKKVIKFEIAWQTSSRSLASKLEYKLKQLKKQEKEHLIKSTCSLAFFIGDSICDNDYIKVDF